MSTSNFDVEFYQLSDDVKGAFIGSIATKERLTRNTLLYRFCGGPGLSPWWTEAKYLPDLLLKAKASKKALYQYVRDTTAILRRWDGNSISHLVIATLNEELSGFKGDISPQNEATIYMSPLDTENYKKKFTKQVFFRGGNSQVYINRFQMEKYDRNDEEMKKKIEKQMDEIQKRYLTYTVPFGTVSIYDDIDIIIQKCHL